MANDKGRAFGSPDLVSDLLSGYEVCGEYGKRSGERVHAIIQDHRWPGTVNAVRLGLADRAGPVV